MPKQYVLASIAGPKRKAIRGVVVVNGTEFNIVAYDKLAEAISVLKAGSEIYFAGSVIKEEWEIGSGQKRERIDFEVLEMMSHEKDIASHEV